MDKTEGRPRGGKLVLGAILGLLVVVLIAKNGSNGPCGSANDAYQVTSERVDEAWNAGDYSRMETQMRQLSRDYQAYREGCLGYDPAKREEKYRELAAAWKDMRALLKAKGELN